MKRRQVTAVACGGAFVPRETCEFAEGTEVALTISGLPVQRAPTTDVAERRRILQTIVESLRQDPLPPGAPRFNRDELHARG